MPARALNQGYILTAAQMRAAEAALMRGGVSVDTLMQRAGAGAAHWIWRLYPNIRTQILCGPGNNGGDGYVIAQWLRAKGQPVELVVAAAPATDAARRAAAGWQGPTLRLDQAKPAPLFIDCLFGTGLTRPIAETLYSEFLRLCDGARHCVAVDIVSGVDSDSGVAHGPVRRFDLTIALGAVKPAHCLPGRHRYQHQLVGVDLGISAASDMRLMQKPVLSAPARDAHKYRRGLVLIVAGEMPGAAWLAAQAAQRAGAGYVRIAVLDPQAFPCGSIVVQPCADAAALAETLRDERIAAVLIGPGLGRSPASRALLDAALASGRRMVLDADALSLLGLSAAERLSALAQPAIVTPHRGEFAAISAAEPMRQDMAALRRFAHASGAVALLKGAETMLAAPDGHIMLAVEGPSWLATAGSGDVLSGVIAAQLASGQPAFAAASTGQWLFERAAQLAGPVLRPEDVIVQLPLAVSECL
jgi:hydroxyethylthiazole kinase-like uncharacterized protein yjeF